MNRFYSKLAQFLLYLIFIIGWLYYLVPLVTPGVGFGSTFIGVYLLWLLLLDVLAQWYIKKGLIIVIVKGGGGNEGESK